METKTYGVYLHSAGAGGYVVRTQYDGWCPAPYSSLEAVKVYAREHAAQNHADKLNDTRWNETDGIPA